MTGFKDLEPLEYFSSGVSKVCVAVGWLDRAMPYPTGPTDERVFRHLKELLVDPFQPFAAAGSHGCNLCQFEPENRGANNLFVPSAGLLLVCPDLIAHYINAHHYAPPLEFTEAVLSCPDTRTKEYRRSFLASGGRALLNWK